MSYPCVGKGIGFSCTLYDLSCPHALTQMAMLLIHTPVFTVLGLLLSTSLATALVQATITYGHRLCDPPTALSLLHISVGEIWKHKSDVCHTAAHRAVASVLPMASKAPCNLVLAGPLPHPFPVHLSLSSPLHWLSPCPAWNILRWLPAVPSLRPPHGSSVPSLGSPRQAFPHT